jgi:hypothetical protein
MEAADPGDALAPGEAAVSSGVVLLPEGHELVAMVAGVKGEGGSDLLQVVRAIGQLGLLQRLLHRGYQQGGQDGDNGNHHQEFDEGESLLSRELSLEPVE